MKQYECENCGAYYSEAVDKCPKCGGNVRAQVSQVDLSSGEEVEIANEDQVECADSVTDKKELLMKRYAAAAEAVALAEAERKAEEERNTRRYEELLSALNAELSGYQRKTIAGLFDEDGDVSAESKAHIEAIVKELNALADLGYGTKGYAESQWRKAINGAKKRSGHNTSVIVAMSAIILLFIFVLISWITAARSMRKFEKVNEELAICVDEDRFEDAEVLIQQAKSDFKPFYLRQLIAKDTDRRLYQLNLYKMKYVDQRVEQISTLIDANDGKIDSFIMGVIDETLKYGPENRKLLLWKKQYEQSVR